MRNVQPRRTGVALASALAALAAVGTFAFSAPRQAAAETIPTTILGPCASAPGTAFRVQARIPVTENTNVGRVTTAFMTMNVEWCSDGTTITRQPAIVTSQADRTTEGATSNLQRESYRSDFAPATSTTSPATILTAATWDRPGTITIGIPPGVATFDPARFESRMVLSISTAPPGADSVNCTGFGPLGPEPCSPN